MFQTKVVEKIKTHILYSIISPESRDAWEVMWKKYGTARQATDDSIRRRKDAVIHSYDTYLLTPWCRVLLEKLTAAIQEIPRISRNPKVHYCTHKRPPPISILGPPNPVHIPTSYLL